jgi:hypothetical protein
MPAARQGRTGMPAARLTANASRLRRETLPQRWTHMLRL